MVVKNVVLAIMMLVISPFFENPNKDYEKRESTILYTLMGLTDYLHYSPKAINDDLSNEIFDDYLDILDQAKRFLLQSEVDVLSKHKFDIDDQINAFNLDFFEDGEKLMEIANDRAKSIYKEVIEKPVNTNDEEIYETDGEKRKFAANLDALYVEWEKLVQYNVISKMYDLDDGVMSEDELKTQAIKSTKRLYDDWFERLEELTRADRFDAFMNTILSQFDPHSSYFSPKKHEDFAIQMGNKLEGIGAQLSQDGDYVKVVSIVPGGPAWKGEELEEDDIIIAVQQKNEKSVDVTGMRIDDVIRMIRGDKGTAVILKVKRTGGITKNIDQRDRMRLATQLSIRNE